MKKILRGALIGVSALLMFGLWLIAIFHISNLWRGDSDNAYLVIAGNAVAKGNYLLHGYYLSQLDPFYSIDIFINALFVKLFDFRPIVMHLAPVFLFLVFILAASFYVTDLKNKDLKNKPAFKTAVFLFILFLVFPSRAFAFWSLQEGMHLSALIGSLTVFLLVDKFRKSYDENNGEGGGKIIGKSKMRPYLFLSFAFIVLVAGFSNDNVNVVICAVPLIVLSLFYILKEVFANGGKKANINAYIFIIAAVVAALLLKEFVFYEIKTHGGFSLAPSGLSIAFVRLKYIQKNLYFFADGILSLLGVNLFGKYLFSIKTLIEIFKITGFVIFIYGVAAAVKKLLRPEKKDFLDLLLLCGMLFMSFAFLISQMPVDRASSRYLLPVAAFGFILALRNFGYSRFVNGFTGFEGGKEAARKDIDKYKRDVFLKLAAVVMFLTYSGSFILNAGAVIPKSPVKPLGKWLIKHDLTYGYGTYWDSGIVTLETKGRVKIRQLIAVGDKIVPYRWLGNKSWYKKTGFFVVYTRHFIWFNKQAIINAFGKPSKIYVEDFQGTLGRAFGRASGRGTAAPYVIMVYKKGIRFK